MLLFFRVRSHGPALFSQSIERWGLVSTCHRQNPFEHQEPPPQPRGNSWPSSPSRQIAICCAVFEAALFIFVLRLAPALAARVLPCPPGGSAYCQISPKGSAHTRLHRTASLPRCAGGAGLASPEPRFLRRGSQQPPARRDRQLPPRVREPGCRRVAGKPRAGPSSRLLDLP